MNKWLLILLVLVSGCCSCPKNEGIYGKNVMDSGYTHCCNKYVNGQLKTKCEECHEWRNNDCSDFNKPPCKQLKKGYINQDGFFVKGANQ